MSRFLFSVAIITLSVLPAYASAEKAIVVPGSTPGYTGGQQALRAPYPTDVQPQPTPMPRPIACTMEAKMCPDGSYVSRTGPNCEFAPCPGGTAGAPPVAQPEEPQGVPDLPVVGIPSSAVSVEFLTTHRSALAGKILTVTGYVTDYCGPNDECGEPRIILNDEADGSGPYSMSVYKSDTDPTTYSVGQHVEIYGEASSEGDTAALRKE